MYSSIHPFTHVSFTNSTTHPPTHPLKQELRLRPLGLDRHHRRYWVFPGDKTHTVYTEDDVDGPVTVRLLPPTHPPYTYSSAFRPPALPLPSYHPPTHPFTQKQTAYKTREDLLLLISWLSDRTPRESALRNRLIPLVDRHFPLPNHPPSSSTTQPDAFLQYQSVHGQGEREAAADLYKYICYPLGITAR